MPRGKPGSGTTAPRARSGTQVAALGYRGTVAAHNWWALPLGNGFDYLTADGNSGFTQIKTMDQMAVIVSDILLGHFAPIASATALANRSVPRTAGNAIPKAVVASESANGAAARKRVRNRVSGQRASPVTTSA